MIVRSYPNTRCIENMKVIILRGISGSGKSMLCGRLKRDCGCDVLSVSADDFWTRNGETYVFDVKKIGEAHAYCLHKFIKHLSEWSTVKHDPLIIVDNTCTRAVEVAPYYALAEAYGATVRIVTIVCDPQLAYDSNNHNTSAKILWGQHQRILNEQLPPWWKQEVAFRVLTASGMDIHHYDGLAFDPERLLGEMSA